MKILSELLQTIKPVSIIGSTDKEITGVNIDSRRIEAGHLWTCRKRKTET